MSAARVCFVLILVSVGTVLFTWSWSGFTDAPLGGHDGGVLPLRQMQNPAHVDIGPDSAEASPTDASCNSFRCLDVYRCGSPHGDRLQVSLSSVEVARDSTTGEPIAPWSRELVELAEAVLESRFYTASSESACVVVAVVDLLHEDRLRSAPLAGRALSSLPGWAGGLNWLLLSMLPGSARSRYAPALGVPHGKAMVAGAGMSSITYRAGFDISWPTYSPAVQQLERGYASVPAPERRWLLVSPYSRGEAASALRLLQDRHPSEVLLLDYCQKDGLRCRAERTLEEYPYPQILGSAKFCLMTRGVRLTHPSLMEALHSGCIPVIAVDGLVLPFEEVIDWKRFSVRIYEHQLENVISLTSEIAPRRLLELQRQGDWVYKRYFSNLKSIMHTTLEILQDRLFPQHSRTYMDWNVAAEAVHSLNPLFLSHPPSASEGFTAVILAYDRVESLFAVMTRVAETPSLAEIVVVWNHQEISPPPNSEWPKLAKPFKVIRTKANVLSNRFFPYDEIQTECILSMDDDIVMLTADELEFGYQVWREFPDRIVGFPSRTHIWNNATRRWKYESEWTSEISMVLTGAAFYHKYWHYLYTGSPSPEAQEIRSWVDANMNCEDIAMNFLVANVTGKAPIKVAPRKKFKCSTPQCTNFDALSGLESHMIERSDCVNLFAQKYGHMPLKRVEFRADPVLYKDPLPDKLKRFNNLGSL